MAEVLNLEADNVYMASITVEQARASFDTGELPEDVTNKLDEAQGRVHSGQSKKAYLVIEIEAE